MNLCSSENSRTIPIGRCEFEQIQYINLFHATALFLYPLKTSENQGFSDVYRRYRTSVIRQKGESQNGCFKKAKHGKFSEKRTFLTPRTCAYQWVIDVSFPENFVYVLNEWFLTGNVALWRNFSTKTKKKDHDSFLLFNNHNFV